MLHPLEPATLYFPAGHTAAVGDVDPAGHAYPALHGPLHDDDCSPLVLPYRPPLHGPLHVTLFRPPELPYVPAGHARQPEPFTKYDPAEHVDGFGVVDPGLHTNPDAHGPLQLAIVSPTLEPYRPAAHGPLHVALVRPLLLPY